MFKQLTIFSFFLLTLTSVQAEQVQNYFSLRRQNSIIYKSQNQINKILAKHKKISSRREYKEIVLLAQDYREMNIERLNIIRLARKVFSKSITSYLNGAYSFLQLSESSVEEANQVEVYRRNGNIFDNIEYWLADVIYNKRIAEKIKKEIMLKIKEEKNNENQNDKQRVRPVGFDNDRWE